MSQASYWDRIAGGRISRRRAILGGIGLATGAAAIGLTGCSSKPPRQQASPSLLAQPEDTTGHAREGGTFKGYLPTEVSTFDALATSNILSLSLVASLTYPRLVKFGAARFPERPRGDIDGDLAETFEMSGDRMQVVFRLRGGLRWENRPPTNNRLIDAQDVVFSWNKFSRNSPLRNDIVYHAESAPASPVDSVSMIDARTVVFRLKQPDSSILPLLAFERLFYVMPRESESAFDPRLETRGYGPWLMAENRAGSHRIWRKNAEYYVKGRPFPQMLEQPVISDYQSRVAQFKAGNIWQSVVSQDDVIRTKKELPQTVLHQSDSYSTTPSFLGFGYNGSTAWQDERLRQAVSLLIDRQTLVNINVDPQRFREEGLDIGIRYHSVVGAGWEGYWQDPTDVQTFGENARFFRYDPREAKKLLLAAGYVDGLETQLHYGAGSSLFPPIYARTAELVSGMLSAGGIRARLDPRDPSDWIANYQNGYTTASNPGRQVRGFGGIIYRSGATYPSVASQLSAMFHKDGVRFMGMTPDGRNPQLGDPEVNRQLEAVRREFNVARQQEMVQEFARFMARKAYFIPMQPHSSLGFSLSWPVIGNLGLFRNWPGGAPAVESLLHQWIDDTKPPISQPTPSPTARP